MCSWASHLSTGLFSSFGNGELGEGFMVQMLWYCMGNIPAPQSLEIIKYVALSAQMKKCTGNCWKLLQYKMPSTTHGLFPWENCKFPREFSWLLTFLRRHWVNQCAIGQPAVINLFLFPSLSLYTYIVSGTSSRSLQLSSSSSEKSAEVLPQVPKLFCLPSRSKSAVRERKQLCHCRVALEYVGSIICTLTCPVKGMEK